MVKARVIAQAFDSMASRMYYPGETVEIDSANPLASLKTPLGKWVFDFPRPEPLASDPVSPGQEEAGRARGRERRVA